MSFLAEQAGGMSTWGPMADQRVLEVVPKAVHQVRCAEHQSPNSLVIMIACPDHGLWTSLNPKLSQALLLYLGVCHCRVEQKSPMFVGSTSEVTKLQDFLKKKASVAA